MRPRRKRWLVGAAAGTVLAIASLVAWLGLRGEPEVSAAQPSPEPAPLPAVRNSVPRAPVPHAAAAAAAVEVSRPEPVTEALQALSEAEARLRHIRMRRAYPLWTQPLDPANVWTEPEPFRGSSSEAAPGGRIFVRPERAWVDLGSPIRFFVTAVDEAGSPAAISGLQGETSARWYGHTPHPRLALSFNDDGANGDEKAGDLVYTGVLELAPERGNAGDWTVSVDGTIGGDRRGASSTVLVVPGDARFTGEFREEIVDGNLVVHAGVEVMRQTFTHVRMELFAGDRPVAQAWASGNSEPGKRMFDVKFYGKVIRDQGIDGPYTVRHAVLSTGGEDGRFPGKAVDPVLETAPYRVTAFTDHNRNEGNALLDEQERLALEDIEAAKGGFGATDPSQQGPRMTRIDKNDTPIPE